MLDSAGAVARAEALIPLLARNAAQTERDRRVMDENIAAIADAGLLRIMVPRRLGGLETPVSTHLAVSEALGRGCGSTAWVTALINICAFFTGLFSERAQNDVFGADPDARVAGVLTPSASVELADGGVRITGRWAWASGSLHAGWALVGTPPLERDGTIVLDQSLALVPMADVRVEDTWFTAGMRGTGSNTLVAENVFVPTHRLLSVPQAIGNHYATERREEKLYRSSFVPFAALILAGPILGMAHGALDYVVSMASKRGITYSIYERQADAPTFQLEIAEAATRLDTARLHVDRALREIDAAAEAGVEMPYLDRARVRMDTGWAVQQAREAIRLLVSAHGASSFAESSPLQRFWRDAETASRHAVIGPEISAEVYGRALLGVPGMITPLV